MLKRIWLIIPALMLQGCPGGYGYKYNTGHLPTTPVNFTEINTVYDEYRPIVRPLYDFDSEFMISTASL